ncbi:trypsin-like serine peptidase [Streptomyces litchfieldiae]|uniref:Trypsin-like peptidase domain-containing protein n=1 Tax=Streptomyces litchfieldiae TaxID=3075543 RepID=A0ABU2MTM1_9ACTN|nr:trypsin-like peptidase domain-containing protein [Streptomyces sp. DSM 44938]MDT0344992.1 trypsin-like peptidase domain-containing protein [Streptomyces sp. DSM 44938]
MNLPRARIPAAALAVAVVLLALGAPPAVAADPWAAGPVSTVGKLIWDAGDGRLGLCSGAVVDAPNGSVIATAAHCVRTGASPEPPAEVWFVPAYDHGRDSYRADGWPVTAFHTPAGWDVSQETSAILPHDYAFLTVGEKDGRTVQEVHGANRLVFEPVGEGDDVAVLGYPAAAPYDGESLHYCAGRTDVLFEGEAQAPNLGGLLLKDCDLTAGSSGGPWLTHYDEATESGTVVAVMSVGSGEGDVVGRPFPEEARELFTAAGGS